jgi:hypothetical protein
MPMHRHPARRSAPGFGPFDDDFDPFDDEDDEDLEVLVPLE